MNWIDSLEYVIVWLKYIFGWCFSFFAKFDGYIGLIILLFSLYFLFNKLLTPIFDGHLPEGVVNSEVQRYASAKNKKDR